MRFVIFLDDAGTMNDPRVRGEQLARLTGAFLGPRLGGSEEAWAAACRGVVTELWAGYHRTMHGNVSAAYPPFRRAWLMSWLRGMCEQVGVPAPADELCIDYALRTEAFCTRRVRAAYPGAVEAIRALYTEGYTLHTASSEHSTELDGYLEGMGVRDCFDRLYGPDLTGTIKEGPLYYERIFADSGVTPEQALVVDDNPLAIGWAKEAGARTARIGLPPGEWEVLDMQLHRLADLPAALASL